MNMDKGVQGFKKADFKEADEVLGADVRIEELPDGIRFFLKGQAVDLKTKRVSCNLYELKDDGDLKFKRVHLEKFNNRIPEEEEIALKYGPGSYIWIAKWLDVTGEQKGIMSEPIEISEKWRARYVEHNTQKAARGEAGLPPAAPAPAALPASASLSDPLIMLKLIQEGEDRALRNMKLMADILKGGQADNPASILKEAYQGAADMMQQAVKTNLDMAKSVREAAQSSIIDDGKGDDQVDDETGEQGADAMPPIPAWLAPFLPQLKAGLDKLLGGGPAASAVKTLILSSDEWKTIFGDKEKFGQAIAAMEANFGGERTQKALDILLNRRKKK